MIKLILDGTAVITGTETGPTAAMRVLGEEILPYLMKDNSPEKKKEFVDLLCEVRSEFIKSPECYAEAKKNSKAKDFDKTYNHYSKDNLEYYYIDSRNSDNLVNGLDRISKALSEYMNQKVEIVYEK